MNQLVEVVQQKTGLSEEMSQKVVDVIVIHIKEKLPAPLASALESFIGGSTTEAAEGGAQAEGAEASGTGGSELMDEATKMVSGLFSKS